MTPITTKLSLSGLLFLATLSGAQARPPTLDPTYGLPLPPQAKSPAAARASANWIWADAAKDNQTVYLRRTFDLAAVPPKATLYVTADDFFTLFVNGKEVDHSAPDPKDGNVWQHVHRVNVAPFLTPGRNVLAIRALNAGGAAGVIARLEMPGRAPVETDARWRVWTGTAPLGWEASAFDDAA